MDCARRYLRAQICHGRWRFVPGDAKRCRGTTTSTYARRAAVFLVDGCRDFSCRFCEKSHSIHPSIQPSSHRFPACNEYPHTKNADTYGVMSFADFPGRQRAFLFFFFSDFRSRVRVPPKRRDASRALLSSPVITQLDSTRLTRASRLERGGREVSDSTGVGRTRRPIRPRRDARLRVRRGCGWPSAD